MPALNQRDAIHYIATRQEFKASALTGSNDVMSSGRLSGAEAEKYNKERDFIHYVVYSYSTPIAWHSIGGWYVVEQKFSQTTSKHQNYVRRAIADSLQGVN
jgi:hypothetical protein